MKRKTALFSMIPFILVFSSCIDITQYVRIEQGNMITNTRLVIQKALLVLAQSYGASSDASQLTFDDAQIQEIRKNMPKEYLVSLDGINTDLESGLDISLRYPPKQAPTLNAGDEAPLFFPYLSGKSLIVDIQTNSSESFDETNQMAAAIVSGFKYRLLIDTSVLSSPTMATIYETDTGNSTEATLITYKGFSIAEVSMAYLLSGKALQLVVE